MHEWRYITYISLLPQLYLTKKNIIINMENIYKSKNNVNKNIKMLDV